MQAADNDAVAIFQTFRDQPPIANRLRCNDSARFHLVFIVYHKHGCITARCTGYPLLGNKDGIRLCAFVNACTDKHTR